MKTRATWSLLVGAQLLLLLLLPRFVFVNAMDNCAGANAGAAERGCLHVSRNSKRWAIVDLVRAQTRLAALNLANGDADTAVDNIENALELEPGNQEVRKLAAVAYFRRAVIAASEDNHTEAIEDFSKSIGFDASSHAVYAARSSSFALMGDHAQALDDLKNALRLSPSHAAYRQQIGEMQRQLRAAETTFSNKTAKPAAGDVVVSPRAAPEEIARKDHSATAEPTERTVARRAAELDRTPRLFENYDLVGADLLTPIRKISREDCTSECRQDPKCQGITYDKWNQWCFLKSEAGSLRLDPKYVAMVWQGVGGPRKSDLPIVMERYRAKAFPYTGQTSRSAESIEDCEARCLALTECMALTYFRTSKQCRLMSGAGEYKSEAEATSAVKRQKPN